MLKIKVEKRIKRKTLKNLLTPFFSLVRSFKGKNVKEKLEQTSHDDLLCNHNFCLCYHIHMGGGWW